MTYRYKRVPYHGHVLNVAETIDGKGNGIVVHACMEPNTQSDSRIGELSLDGLSDKARFAYTKTILLMK